MPPPQRTPLAQIEVRGQGLIAIIDAMSLIQTHAQKILAAHGISPIEADKWYSMQKVMEAFKIIEERIGPSTMKAIGRKVPEYARFPPHLTTLEDALGSLDPVYRLGHRGPGHIGSYLFKILGARSAQVTADSPYTCELDEGMLETLCERFKPKSSLWVRVAHQPGSCRKRGDQACTYDISW